MKNVVKTLILKSGFLLLRTLASENISMYIRNLYLISYTYMKADLWGFRQKIGIRRARQPFLKYITMKIENLVASFPRKYKNIHLSTQDLLALS